MSKGTRTLAALVLGLLILGGLVAVGPLLTPSLQDLREAPSYPGNRAAGLATQIAALETPLPGVPPAAPKDRLSLQRDLLQYETDNEVKIWTAIVGALGGAVLLANLLFTALGLRATQAKLNIDREGQVTSRFTEAIDQLGSKSDGELNLEVRLGGIYALEQIARDSDRYRGPVLEVLAAYIRAHAAWNENTATPRQNENAPPGSRADIREPRADIQAALAVIGRCEWPIKEAVDLAKTDLRGAKLRGAHLNRVSFWDAHLEGADLEGADLHGAYMHGAHLQNATLTRANLTGATLSCADLTRAVLIDTRLEGADTIYAVGLPLSDGAS